MNQRGYTLAELLAAILVLTGLALGGYFLIHPKNYDDALQNAERRSGVAYTVQAINRYYAAQGHLPDVITTKAAFIGSGTGNIDLCKALVPTYAPDLPLDPILSAQSSDDRCDAEGQNYLTGYLVWRSQDGKTVTVSGSQPDTSHKISVSHHYGK